MKSYILTIIFSSILTFLFLVNCFWLGEKNQIINSQKQTIDRLSDRIDKLDKRYEFLEDFSKSAINYRDRKNEEANKIIKAIDVIGKGDICVDSDIPRDLVERLRGE